MRAVVAEVTPASMGMRLPYSYQSRPASLPSLNTFFGALLRASYLIGKEPAYRAVAEAVQYVTYSVEAPLNTVTTTTVRTRLDYEGYSGGGKKHSNVFQESYIIPASTPAFKAVFIVRDGAEEAVDDVTKAAASITLLGDSDSPASTGAVRVCSVKEIGHGLVPTKYATLLSTVRLVKGDAIIAEAPVIGYREPGATTMKREFTKIVIPARVRGATIMPSHIFVEPKGSSTVAEVCEDTIILPPPDEIAVIRERVGLP